MTAAPLDLPALLAEEQDAAAQSAPDAYRALLEHRLTLSPTFFNPALLERTIAEKPWADALRPVASRILNCPATPPALAVMVNTFPRVPTAAAEAVLIQNLGLRRGSLHSANAGYDQAFDRLTALREIQPKTLVRGHVTGTVRVRAYFALFGLRPILLVRNIFDTLASYYDDRVSQAVAPGYRFSDLEPADRRRITVLRMASQLVDFHASWAIEDAEGRARLHRWEDVREDWPGFLADRLADCGHPVARDTIAAQFAAQPPDAHAEIGKGAGLSDADKALVRSLYAQYPHVDFRPIDAEAPALL